MRHTLRTTDLLGDLETYRLWQNISKEENYRHRATPQLRGMGFERHILNLLYDLGFRTLAGRVRELRGLSSITHENDVVVFKPGAVNRLLIVECKFRRKGSMIGKDHVMLFYQRVQDISMYYTAIGYPKALLPVFVSSVPLDRNAFRFCLTYGILALHPCYEEPNIYPSMVSCRPPLAALRYQLSFVKVKEPSRGVILRLEKGASRLHEKTIRYVSPLAQGTGPLLDGNKLEKAYFDILYRCKSILGSW